jgi:glycerol-3-phosphate acyltransferase PlsY
MNIPTSSPIAVVAVVVLAYLIGAIPVGLLIVRIFTGRDIRSVGSGRTGGTNAMRAAGPVAGVLTGFADVGKGFLAVSLPRLILSGPPGSVEIIAAVCGIAAVAGHNWPIYLRFKGGAGATPNVGAAVAMWPITLALVPIGAILLVATGYASVTSTIVSFAIVIIFALRAILAHQPISYVGYSIGTFILIAISLLPNYRRLIAGTERLVGPRAKLRSAKEDVKG